MSNADSKGVERYVQLGREYLARRKKLRAEMRQARFDTIAVHGMYSVEEAFAQGQGGIIEPIFPSTSQGYRDSDEMEAGLAYQIPTWCYSRIHQPHHLLPGGHPVAARGLRLPVRRLGLLHLLGHGGDQAGDGAAAGPA